MWVSPFIATPEAVKKSSNTAKDELYSLGAGYINLTKLAGTPQSVYSLAGRLIGSKSGWLLLEVPNSIIRGMFDALHEPGIELPLYEGKLKGHITVANPDELAKVGGPDAISERGHSYSFQLGPVKTATPRSDEYSKVWFIEVRSPELNKLRASYGLGLPTYPYHITIAYRRKNVLGDNDVSKKSAEAVFSVQEDEGSSEFCGVQLKTGQVAVQVQPVSEGVQGSEQGTNSKICARKLLEEGEGTRKEATASFVEDNGTQNLAAYDLALLRSKVPAIQELWRARYNSLQKVAGQLRRLLPGYGQAAIKQAFIGSNQCGQQLRAIKLPMGNMEGTATKQTKQSSIQLPWTITNACRMGGENWNRSCNNIRKDREVRLDSREGVNSAAKVAFDLSHEVASETGTQSPIPAVKEEARRPRVRVFLPTGRDYLLQRAISNPKAYRVPGGGVEPGETHQQAIEREIHEEFGKKPSSGELKYLGADPRPQFPKEYYYLWNQHNLQPGKYQASNDPKELVELVKRRAAGRNYWGPPVHHFGLNKQSNWMDEVKSDGIIEQPSKHEKVIYVVRHGKTELNSGDPDKDRIRGWKDVPLSTEGKKEAERLALLLRDVKPTHVLSSNLSRTEDTAKKIGEATGTEVKAGVALRPWNVGKYQGQISSQVHPILADHVKTKPDVVLEGGESFNQFKDRYLKLLKTCMEGVEADEAGPIILVAHFRNLKITQAWMADGCKDDNSINEEVFLRNDLPTGAILKLTCNENGKWKCELEAAAGEENGHAKASADSMGFVSGPSLAPETTEAADEGVQIEDRPDDVTGTDDPSAIPADNHPKGMGRGTTKWAADFEPESVIDRPKGFQKSFLTAAGKKTLTYPLDYGYFKGMINPEDKEDVDLFFGSGGPHYGRFHKGSLVSGDWKPDEHKYYHGLTSDELQSLKDWWGGQDPGLIRDWTAFKDRKALVEDIKARTQWSGSQKVARDLLTKTIIGRYGLTKQADEQIGHYKPKVKVKRDAFGYLSPKGDEDKFAQCETCRAWTGPDHNTCLILGKEHVTANMSCNYYQHGRPSPDGAGKEHRIFTPRTAGLVKRPVRCENCAFFDEDESYCELYEHLAETHPDAFDLDTKVDAKGCCNFQVPKGEKIEEESKAAALCYLEDELSKEKEAAANRISLTVIDPAKEEVTEKLADWLDTAKRVGAGVGALGLGAAGAGMLYHGWKKPGMSFIDMGHNLWLEPENHERLTQQLGDPSGAAHMISMAKDRPKIFRQVLTGHPIPGLDPEFQKKVRHVTFGSHKEHMKSLPGDILVSGEHESLLGKTQPFLTGSSAMHADVGGLRGGDWLGLWTAYAQHPTGTKPYFKNNPTLRVAPWDVTPKDRYRIGLRPREAATKPIDQQEFRDWLTKEQHPFGEHRYAELALGELLPELKYGGGHRLGPVGRMLASSPRFKRLFARAKMPQSYQTLIEKGYTPEQASEVCSSFAAQAIKQFSPKLIPGEHSAYSPAGLTRLAERGGPYRVHQIELPRKMTEPQELESEHHKIKWGPLLWRLPIAAGLLGGAGYLGHQAFKTAEDKQAGLLSALLGRLMYSGGTKLLRGAKSPLRNYYANVARQGLEAGWDRSKNTVLPKSRWLIGAAGGPVTGVHDYEWNRMIGGQLRDAYDQVATQQNLPPITLGEAIDTLKSVRPQVRPYIPTPTALSVTDTAGDVQRALVNVDAPISRRNRRRIFRKLSPGVRALTRDTNQLLSRESPVAENVQSPLVRHTIDAVRNPPPSPTAEMLKQKFSAPGEPSLQGPAAIALGGGIGGIKGLAVGSPVQGAMTGAAEAAGTDAPLLHLAEKNPEGFASIKARFLGHGINEAAGTASLPRRALNRMAGWADPGLGELISAGKDIHSMTNRGQQIAGQLRKSENPNEQAAGQHIGDVSSGIVNQIQQRGTLSNIFHQLKPSWKRPVPQPAIAASSMPPKLAAVHDLKAVKIKRRDKEVSICPHCGKEVEDKDLYRDAKGWIFHRPCFVKGKGAIKLGASPDSWVARVMATSDATSPPPGIFTQKARHIVEAGDSEDVAPKGIRSWQRMVLFHKNRGGSRLPEHQKVELDKAIKLLSKRISERKMHVNGYDAQTLRKRAFSGGLGSNPVGGIPTATDPPKPTEYDGSSQAAHTSLGGGLFDMMAGTEDTQKPLDDAGISYQTRDDLVNAAPYGPPSSAVGAQGRTMSDSTAPGAGQEYGSPSGEAAMSAPAINGDAEEDLGDVKVDVNSSTAQYGQIPHLAGPSGPV